MAIAPTLAVAIVGAAFAGIGNGVEAVAARTALQEETEERWMALMMSFNEAMFQSVPGAGIVIGGAITALGSPRAALAVAGAGSLRSPRRRGSRWIAAHDTTVPRTRASPDTDRRVHPPRPRSEHAGPAPNGHRGAARRPLGVERGSPSTAPPAPIGATSVESARERPPSSALRASPASSIVRRACIDIGSNTTRLLVADCDGERLLEIHQERCSPTSGGA